MPKNVELLDNVNDILYPKTKSEQVIVTSTQNLSAKLTDIDTKIKDVTDEVVAARNKTGNTHQTLKSRLDAMEDDSTAIQNIANQANNTANTVKQEVESARNGQANLKVRIDGIDTRVTNNNNSITSLTNQFNTLSQEVVSARNGQANLKTRIDSIDDRVTDVTNEVNTARDGEVSLSARLNDMQNGIDNKVDSADVDVDATNDTIPIRNNDGQLNAKAYRLIDTNGNYKGALDCSATPMVGDPFWLNDVTSRKSKIWNEENLLIDNGIFTPTALSNNANLMVDANNSFGKYRRIGNLCFVSGRVSFSNPQNLSGDLKIGGFPFQPQVAYEPMHLGMFHGLNYPQNAKEIKGHMNTTFMGFSVYYTTHDNASNSYVRYDTNSLSQQGSSIIFSGVFSLIA